MRAWAVVETGQPLQEIEMPTPEPKGAEVLLEVTDAGVEKMPVPIMRPMLDKKTISNASGDKSVQGEELDPPRAKILFSFDGESEAMYPSNARLLETRYIVHQALLCAAIFRTVDANCSH